MKILFLFLMLISVASGQRVALVIGADAYDHLDVNDQLQQAVRDAGLMKTTLEGLPEKFEVITCLDKDFAGWKAKWNKFKQKAVGAECALVFYAGHGIEYHGENYFLPRDFQMLRELESVEDTKELLERKAFSLRGMTLELAEAGPSLSVVVLDCCRDNPVSLPAEGGRTKSLGRSVGLARVARQPAGSLIAYAADAGGKANDGIYTEVLTKYLKQADLRVMEAFAKTREEVLETTKKWNAEDQERGLSARNRRPVQHTGEYQRLNFAGIRFSFGSAHGSKGDEGPVLPPKVKGSDLAARAQWQELMLKMEADYVAAGKLGGVKNWKLFLGSYGALSNPYSEEDERMLAIARERSVRPAMEGTRAGEEREFEIAPGVQMTMCWIPAGKFRMGSPDSEEGRRSDNEGPVREVTISRGFWMAKHETTQAQWEGVTRENPSRFKGAQKPVESVSWEDCQGFISKLSRVEAAGWTWRLPSEAEWEYGCRAGTGTVFGLPDEEGKYGVSYLSSAMANFNGNYPYGGAAKRENRKETLNVGSFRANAWGLQDMHGNVYEWCGDWYGASYAGIGRRDPGGPSAGSRRVVRGGGWGNTAAFCRSAGRFGFTPSIRFNSLGFRVVLQSQEPVTE